MILKMAYDIRYFVFILGVVIVGFAQAFWLLSYNSVDLDSVINDDKLTFDTVPKALQNIFYSMLNGFANPTNFRFFPVLGFVYIVVFSLIVSLLMLNLLIAIMASTYDQISSDSEAHWRYQQATIMIEEINNSPQVDHYVHILRKDRIIDIHDTETTSVKSQDKIAQLSKELNQVNDKLNKVLSILLDQGHLDSTDNVMI